MSWSVEGLARLLEVILAGGVGVVFRDIIQYFIKRRTDASPDVRRMTEQGVIEKALLNVSHSNDELTEDVTRLRGVLAAEQQRNQVREEWWQSRWDAREVYWEKKEASMRVEIDTMREKMLALLGELDELRSRLATQVNPHPPH